MEDKEERIAEIDVAGTFDINTEIEEACQAVRQAVKSLQMEFPNESSLLKDVEISHQSYKLHLNLHLYFR